MSAPLSYAALALALPASIQSNGWLPHAAVALLELGADTNAVSLDALTQHMTLLAGQDVSRVSSTRGAWVMDKHDMLGASKKGTYLLNDRGVAYARTMRYGSVPVVVEAPVAPVVVEVAPVAPVAPVVVEAPVVVAPVASVAPVSAGVSWLPPEAGTGTVDAYYEGDEYLLSLAVEQTPCFGTYSPRAEACASCPISGACMNMLVSRMAAVAATLAKRDEEALKAAEARKVEEARLAAFRKEEERKAEERKAVESILGTPATPVVNAPSTGKTVTFDTFTPVSAPAAPTPVAAAAAQVKYTKITAAFPGVCSACKGKVTKGDTVCYVSGKGMYHPSCLA